MFLIPTWVLLLELGFLEFIMLIVYLRHRDRNLGKIAGMLLLPLAYVFVTYAMIDSAPLEDARILARYSFSVLFFAMIILFGRILLIRKQ